MTGFLVTGAIFALAGLTALVIALRGDRTRPRTVAMLIAGMMATAFGLLLGGFAIATRTAPPPDLSSAGAR